jgi:hypothetical protein
MHHDGHGFTDCSRNISRRDILSVQIRHSEDHEMVSYVSSDSDPLDARSAAFMRRQQSLPDESYASDTNSAAGADEEMLAQSNHPSGSASRLLKSVLGLPESERIGMDSKAWRWALGLRAHANLTWQTLFGLHFEPSRSFDW